MNALRLETPRLVLRKAREDDLDAIWRNVWRDETVARYMLWQPTLTRADAEARMARTLAYQAGGHSYFACLRDTDEPIGFAGIREEAPGVWEDCGICVAVAHQRRGYGREIVGALLALAFDGLGADAFIYGCFRENAPSAALCRSLGFAYDHSADETRRWDGLPYVCDYYIMPRDGYRRLHHTTQEAD